MAHRIEKEIDVEVPVATAYNQWTQFEEFPQFMEGVERVTQVDDTHLHWKAEILGVAREWDAEIVSQTPDQSIAWRSVTGTRNDGTVTFTDLGGDACRIQVAFEIEPEGLLEQAGDKLGLIGQRIASDLRRFKDFIESRGVETGAWRGDVYPGEAQAGTAGTPAGSTTDSMVGSRTGGTPGSGGGDVLS